MSAAGPCWFGDRAVLVPLPSREDRTGIAAALAAALPACDVRPGLASVLVEAREPDPGLLDLVCEELGRVGPIPRAGVLREVVEIVVDYSGEDLDAVAAGLGCGRSDLVEAHQRQHWVVAMMGFAPGFGYLVPEGEPLLAWESVARLDRPRTQVPAGSVAVAAGMSAVYPVDMPGGWHLIGASTARLFDPSDPHRPTLLRPGGVVRFRADR